MMTPEEKRERSLEAVTVMFDLDEFQQIAVRTIMDEVGYDPKAPRTPEQEELLMSLGAIVSEKFFPSLFPIPEEEDA